MHFSNKKSTVFNKYIVILHVGTNLRGKRMVIISSINNLKNHLQPFRNEGRKIGFVPTMGALHKGHASLVERCVNENDITVVSIFVNPTQFNDPNDLKNYPRTLEADCQLLNELKVDIVFAPNVEEIYPEPDTRTFSYPPIDSVMEGAKRPGHFNGVCQIVSKLFDWVSPHIAYFGEKDFQQIAVIKAMVKALNIPVEIAPCPIVRECNGLALSSRNTLLSEHEKEAAVNISKILAESIQYAKNHNIESTTDFVINEINKIPELEVEYFQIVDGDSLQCINAWEESKYIVGCATVYCGQKPVRLIDNIKYKG